MGAYASFTCGLHKAGGGLTIAGPKPPSDDLVIGYIDEAGTSHCLPFFKGSGTDLENYVEGASETATAQRVIIDAPLERSFAAATDTWTAGDFRFSIFTPVTPMPDPEQAGEGATQAALLPAVVMELELTNNSAHERTLVFAIGGMQLGRVLDGAIADGVAVGHGLHSAIAARGDDVSGFVHWSEQGWWAERRNVRLGSVIGLAKTVPAGSTQTLTVVAGFHQPGIVTTGQDAQYFYTRTYGNLPAVLNAGLDRAPDLIGLAHEQDRALSATNLDANQQFLVAHAERSYWGNSQLLDIGGKPQWVVYEGEYAMMNTFDLSIDQVFYELRRNPWVVRNLADQFVDRYSFHDELARPAPDASNGDRPAHCHDPNRLAEMTPPPIETGLPGGISFVHDMGVAGHFTPAGTSSYESSKLVGCFSHMTSEQLLNWILFAGTYVLHSDDEAWLRHRAPIFQACLLSLLNRDDPVAEQRNGVVSLDSSRTEGGWEITTYDSLDSSLGQARNNLYMATKAWAAWLALERCLTRIGDAAGANEAAQGASRAAVTITGHFDNERGYIPAVFEGGNASAIIPAIEGLVFPLFWGENELLTEDGPFAALMQVLKKHTQNILKPGVCLFEDQGWKLSNTADNSWCSKIFISQFVAERAFGLQPAAASHSAHAHWQQIGSKGWAMCDQCINGVGKASRYYPRCVTNDLWLLS
jgi:hypothetical protein